ncbi:MAG: hypothetical protein NTZ90_16970 [Proteobacteria bacterium]|nr:hypothetical protein [Pseudomonadota bacterium]
MAAVANQNRVELTLDSDVFNNLVKIIIDNDELTWLGLEPFGQIGSFRCKDVPSILAFCADYIEYHIVTYTSGDRYVNRYVPGESIYMLATGDKNPYLVFNPWISPRRYLVEEDLFSKLCCEPDQIKRRRKS